VGLSIDERGEFDRTAEREKAKYLDVVFSMWDERHFDDLPRSSNHMTLLNGEKREMNEQVLCEMRTSKH
jgi:hypothetical protein